MTNCCSDDPVSVLMEPKWNVKAVTAAFFANSSTVLMEPKWNVKFKKRAITRPLNRINGTKVECKGQKNQDRYIISCGINGTKVECKDWSI